ncbi:MAG: UDP-glucose 4-epimerase GalE [Oscillospiraceae bacterium]|nr:UDP-glucose 4-epimerase GalE [Oscillospiraceae bacterium]
MSILVTGGAGYIGSHTCVELIHAGHDVVVLDNFSNSSLAAVDRTRALAGEDFSLYRCDIRDREGLRNIFQKESIDAVIHFAGLKSVGQSCSMPLEYYENNIGGSVTLFQVMAEFGCKKMVFSSSATVYGQANQAPFSEDMPVGGTTNPYGTTKLFIEKILQDAYAADKDWSVSLLRYFNPVGAHKSGRIGEDPNDIPNNLMPYVSQVAIGRLPYLNVYGDDYPTPDGTGVRDYIHVVDLALGHISAVERVLKQTGLEIFNLGTGKGHSVLEMVRAFEAASGVNVPYQITARRPGDVAVSFADCEKAAAVLGWKAERGLAEMCEDTWRWQKNNPDGYEAAGE